MTIQKTGAAPFTPGPWTANLDTFALTNGGERYVMQGGPDDPEYSRVALVSPRGDRKRSTPYNAPDAERDANARLIAAAPSLYAALVGLIDVFEGFPTHSPNVRRAREAIRLVGGE